VLLSVACSSGQDDGAAGDQGSVLASAQVMPCAVAGGECRAAAECGRGTGTIGSSKYNCGGSRRVCCFTTCGTSAEDFECCNKEHTYAPRPVCNDAQLACAGGEAKVPIRSCIAAPRK
jgi:hypothetical protein